MNPIEIGCQSATSGRSSTIAQTSPVHIVTIECNGKMKTADFICVDFADMAENAGGSIL
jgi:hypothetical protein